MNWVDYRKKLGIGFNDDDKLYMCKNRILNYIPKLAPFYTQDHIFRYFNTVGELYSSDSNVYQSILHWAYNSVCKTNTMVEFISKFTALINSCYDPDEERNEDELLEILLTSTLEVYRIPYEIIRDEDGIFIFPKGVEEFDKELVSQTLLWLAEYPETEKAWSKALRKYAEGNDPSDVADDFRKTLERFFQNFFESDKTLEHLKKEYGQYLCEHGIPGEIAGNLETILQQYANFMNNNAKHHDKTSKNVVSITKSM